MAARALLSAAMQRGCKYSWSDLILLYFSPGRSTSKCFPFKAPFPPKFLSCVVTGVVLSLSSGKVQGDSPSAPGGEQVQKETRGLCRERSCTKDVVGWFLMDFFSCIWAVGIFWTGGSAAGFSTLSLSHRLELSLWKIKLCSRSCGFRSCSSSGCG